ncbi:hypothetical protein JZ751_003287 [Albula glossodonta]|uniref:Uncharacterized protein n=1 Tax=Albula glossodonta TaxID=121402 RepID=A0A8T2NE88_9TELE|nr:hypothetical protein JZ751_003287 [Albula glossodonta]
MLSDHYVSENSERTARLDERDETRWARRRETRCISKRELTQVSEDIPRINGICDRKWKKC